MSFWSRWFGRDLEARLETLRARSSARLAKGDVGGSAAAAQSLCELARDKLGVRHPWYAEGLLTLCPPTLGSGRPLHGLALCDEADAIFREVHGPHHPLTLDAVRSRRSVRKILGDEVAVRRLGDEFVAGCEAIDPAAPWEDRPMDILLGAADTLVEAGDLALAEAAFRKYDESALLHGREGLMGTSKCLRSRVVLHGKLGDFARADPLIRRSLDFHRREIRKLADARRGSERAAALFQFLPILRESYQAYLDVGRHDLADGIIAEAHETGEEIARSLGKPGTLPVGWLSFDRGRVAWRLGRIDEAVTCFAAAAAILHGEKPQDLDRMIDSLDHLMHAHAARGDLVGAEKFLEMLLRLTMGVPSIQVTERMALLMISMSRFNVRALAAGMDPGITDRHRERWTQNAEATSREAVMRYMSWLARCVREEGGEPIGHADVLRRLRSGAERAASRGDALAAANFEELARVFETQFQPPVEAAPETRDTGPEPDLAGPDPDWDFLARAISEVSEPSAEENPSAQEKIAQKDNPAELGPAVTVDQWRAPDGPSAAAWTASWTSVSRPEASPDGPETWRVGDVIGGLYRVDQAFGGGMGVVYRVRHLSWAIDLAVKSPRPEYFRRPEHREAFTREAEAWMELGLHPNTVSCFYVRTIGGVPRVFAEFVDGPSLAGAIAGGWLDEPEGEAPRLARRLDVAIQLARALAHAHGKGLVHQDVKPANVLISPDGIVKLCDFGLARALASTEAGEDPSTPYAGMTPAYCSPEQEARLPLTPKTDVWSFAATILETFLGRREWKRGPEAGQALRTHLAGTDAASDRPAIPQGLADLLGRCLVEDVEGRAGGMGEIAGELARIYRESTGRDYPRPATGPVEGLADSLNNRGISLLDLGRWREAERAFGEALRVRPEHLESTYNLALLRWRSGSLADDDVLDQLGQAAAGRPSGDRRVALLTALIHVERGDCDSALSLLDAAGDGDPDPELAALRIAAEAMRAGSRSLLREIPIQTPTIPSVRWSGPGDLVLACCDPPALFDVSDGRRIRDLGVARPDRPQAFAVPDASGRLAMTYDMKGYKSWDLATGRCLREIESAQTYKSVAGGGCALGADGGIALVRGAGGGVILIDPESGAKSVRLEASEDATQVMARLTLSPDGTRASDCDMTRFLAWELPSGRQIRRMERPSFGPATALDRSGRLALTGGDSCVALYWEVDTGRIVSACRGHRDAIFDLAIAPDGRHAVSAGADGTMRYWELATGRCLRTFSGARGFVMSAAIDANGGRAVATGEDGCLRAWQLAPGWSSPAPWQPSRAAAGDEAASTDATFRREIEAAREALAEGDPAGSLRHAEAARGRPGCDRRPEALAIWHDLANRLPRGGLRGGWSSLRLAGFEGHARGIDIAADSRTAISGCDDGKMRLWDLTTGKCLRTFEGHGPGEYKTGAVGTGPKSMPLHPAVWSVSMSPDGRRAVTAGYHDLTVRLWDLETGTVLFLSELHTAQVLAVAFSPDGRLILSGGADRKAHLWDAATGRHLRTATCPGSVVAVRWGPDGRRAFLLSVDRGVRAWDVATDEVVVRIEWPPEAMNRFVKPGVLALMMPDANLSVKVHSFEEYSRRASKAPTMNAYSFDVDAAGRRVLIGTWMMPVLHAAEGGPPLQFLKGPEGVVGAVALSPDGRHALSGGKDQLVRLWDTATGECLRAFEGHNSEVTCLRFSPDGTFALSGGFGEIRRWSLDWELTPAAPTRPDASARPHLEAFLRRQTPCEAELPLESALPSFWEVRRLLTRKGKPAWNEEDFEGLMKRLGELGLGGIDREAVREQLSALADVQAGR